jgi:DNA repair protein RecN (Recombination protein N)
MLQTLSIQNVALIRSLSLTLDRGLNVLSGETGAGKSILIDAVNLVLGVRGDRDLIQYGQDRARVEAVFCDDAPETKALLEEMGIEPEENEITLSRVLYASGRNVCRINGELVNNAALRRVAERLIDIHGQHEHQSLLRTAEHIGLLDAFAGAAVKKEKQAVAALLAQSREIKKRIDALGGIGEDRERRLDVLRYQINEIERAELQENEDEALQEERRQLMEGEKTAQSYAYVLNCLANEDGQGAVTLLRDASREIRGVKGDETAAKLADDIEQAFFAMEAAADELRLLQDAFDYDPQRLDQIGERLDELQTLKRKYGGSLESVQQSLVRAYEQLEELQNAEQTMAELEQAQKQALTELYAHSLLLHEAREKAAQRFASAVQKELADLGMQRAKFSVQFALLPEKEEIELPMFGENGLDTVEFMLSANPGEPQKPLAKVASGGEASRIMLALKNIAANLDGIDSLIFDEIDTGISGRMAQVVAEKMAQIAKTRQVICITHLAQLASMADTHYLIEKTVENDETRTRVHRLDETARQKEVARLLGGEGESGHGMLHAGELIEKAKAYKNSL